MLFNFIWRRDESLVVVFRVIKSFCFTKIHVSSVRIFLLFASVAQRGAQKQTRTFSNDLFGILHTALGHVWPCEWVSVGMVAYCSRFMDNLRKHMWRQQINGKVRCNKYKRKKAKNASAVLRQPKSIYGEAYGLAGTFSKRARVCIFVLCAFISWKKSENKHRENVRFYLKLETFCLWVSFICFGRFFFSMR